MVATQNIRILMNLFGDIKKSACPCECRKRTRAGGELQTAGKGYFIVYQDLSTGLSILLYFILSIKYQEKYNMHSP